MDQVMSSDWLKEEMKKFHDWFDALLKQESK